MNIGARFQHSIQSDWVTDNFYWPSNLSHDRHRTERLFPHKQVSSLKKKKLRSREGCGVVVSCFVKRKSSNSSKQFNAQQNWAEIAEKRKNISTRFGFSVVDVACRLCLWNVKCEMLIFLYILSLSAFLSFCLLSTSTR